MSIFSNRTISDELMSCMNPRSVNFKELRLRDEVIRYLNSEAKASDYAAYYGWGGHPCGISRKGGNADIMSAFSNGISVEDSFWCCYQWDPDAVAREVRAIANVIIPNNQHRWKYELPILRAVTQLRRLPIKGSLSARTVAKLFELSVPRAEYVVGVVWG